MTDKPTPTDAELEALLLDKLPASKHYIRPVIEKMVAAMQAAIDKWGQPAQPVEREPLSDDEVDSLCKVGPVYAPDGKVTLTPPQYRYALESAQRYGLRKGERAHGIKKRDPHVE